LWEKEKGENPRKGEVNGNGNKYEGREKESGHRGKIEN